MAVAMQEWVRLLESEYLEGFIASGGAAVKIAVAPPEEAAAVADAVARAAADNGYFLAAVDAAQTRIHMIDQVFYAVSRQVDWDAVTQGYLRSLFHANGVLLPEGLPLSSVDALAEANGRTPGDLLQEINRLIVNAVLRDYTLSREFRTAVTMLCRGQVNPQNVSPTDADTIKQWLRGERCSLTALKRLQIYQRVGRHNARLLLGSLARWLRQVGFPGLVLMLDINAVVAPRPPGDGAVRYTRNTVLDAYEVLRQFIDDVDEVEYLFVGVVAGPGLLDDPRRNLDNYTALKMRVVDEVRDRDRANPLNAMVRVDAASEGETAWTSTR